VLNSVVFFVVVLNFFRSPSWDVELNLSYSQVGLSDRILAVGSQLFRQTGSIRNDIKQNSI